MKTLCSLILFFLIEVGALAQIPVQYQKGTIDLRGNVDLKMLFDGGLRPTQTPGLETDNCQVDNLHATIIFPGNRTVTMLVDRALFGVDKHKKLESIDFYGPFQPINEAINQAESIARILSLNQGNLENIRANSGSYIHPILEGWGQEVNTTNFRVRFVMRPQYHYTINGADMIFAYRYKYPSGQNYSSSTNPIQPPAEYANCSMTPPPWHPTGPAFPALTFEQVKARAQKAFEQLPEKEKMQLEEELKTSNPTQSITSKSEPTENKADIHLILYTILTLLLGGVVWFVIRRRH
jgi:hypothetical protein